MPQLGRGTAHSLRRHIQVSRLRAGSFRLAAGSFRPSDDTVRLPDGTLRPSDGTVRLPAGTVRPPDGTLSTATQFSPWLAS